jgi:CDP-diacylglycerol---serine O-phosphatidyltransferase
MTQAPMHVLEYERKREHRRRRMRRHGRRAYIRSVYLLPSMATLGNAVCGFAAIYVAALAASAVESRDPLTDWWAREGFVRAAYLIFLAMIFDALDGRLARFARHTTDFGGQLDSLADVISFGAAPAFIALELMHVSFLNANIPFPLTRLIWAIGALYFSCAAIRLARFNVSNEHGEQHHFSFLGLPSPGAGGAVAAWILMQQDLAMLGRGNGFALFLSRACLWLLPVIVLVMGLLMVSAIRYPHIVNKYLRGRQPVMKLLAGVTIVLLLVVWHQYALGIGMQVYALYGIAVWIYGRARRRHVPPLAA